jgi:biopolymer transport protein ExbB
MNHVSAKLGMTLLLSLALSGVVQAAEPVSLDELLQQVRSGRIKDAEENAVRVQNFRNDRSRQTQRLSDARAEQVREEQRSDRLETSFEENDLRIIDLEQQLVERLGDLKELFGVLQQAAGDARGQFDNSVTQIQFPDRSAFMTEFAQKMGQTNRFASLEEIERLWFELQQEMTETGKVVTFPTQVVTADGESVEREVTRVGAFNVISEGKYLEYIPETGRLLELQRQPQSRYLKRLGPLESAESGLHAFGMDPTRGQLLGLLVQSPSLTERIAQGKVVGYVIIVIGVIGVLIAIWRLLALSAVGAQVNKQVKNPAQPGNNPLGRVLKVYESSPGADVESLEQKI